MGREGGAATGEHVDVVVVGGGHNGLTAAAYLAREGLRVLVCERRGVLGGATVTEEVAPGVRASTASYALGLLRPDIERDLGLRRHGLVFTPKDPQMFIPLADERRAAGLLIWRDAARTVEEINRLLPRDAEGYRRFGAFWEEAAALLRPLFDDPEPPPLAGVERYLAGRGREDVWRLAVAGSAAETVEEFFASDPLQGAFAGQGIIGTARSPREPGTAWVMAYHLLGGELNGMTGTWAWVRGGMGALAGALARAAREAGAIIRTGRRVEEILLDDDPRVGGVRVGGDGATAAEAVRAPIVVSGADPVRTFLGLIPPEVLEPSFRRRVEEWKTPGSVVKANLVLGELPAFGGDPLPGPQHRATIEIAPSIPALAEAFDAARAGRYPDHPFMEVFIQSAVDPTLAPPDRHVLSAFTQWAPAGPGAWGRERPRVLEGILATLGRYAPNLPGAVLAADVLGPDELEERFGLTGGNIFHGEITPEQSFGERFTARTPVAGLYLCGSGAAPGGAVTGAPGRNAARAVLADLARGPA